MIALGIDTGANGAWALVDVPSVPGGMPRVIDCGSLPREGAGAWLASYLIDTAARVIGIESVTRVFPRVGFGTGMATAIADGERMVGELRREATAAGFVPVVATAATVRKSIVGKARPSNAMIANWVKVFVWCKVRTNNHERDAIVMAVYAAREWLKGGL